MQVAKKRNFLNVSKKIDDGFLDPSTCLNYIKRTSSSDDACIKIDTIAENSGGPWTFQFILQPLDNISSDRKCLEIRCGNLLVDSIHIISGGWRTRFTNKDFSYIVRMAGGSYDSRNANINVQAIKCNWIANARTGVITLNNQRIQDISTISITDQQYYILHNDYGLSFDKIITHLYIMGIVGHDWGNLNYKFYGLKMWDKNNKLFIYLEPRLQNGIAGIYDYCTNLFWQKNQLTGSFEFGTDVS